MTILKNQSGDGFILKTKNTQVTILRNLIEVGDFRITNPGEYDVAQISCDVQNLGKNINSLIELETILVGALDASINSEDFTKVAILLMFIDNASDFKSASTLVSKIEPQLVFYLSKEKIESKIEPLIEVVPSPYKISKNELVYEGTRHLIFE